jgi:hypothetical protein
MVLLDHQAALAQPSLVTYVRICLCLTKAKSFRVPKIPPSRLPNMVPNRRGAVHDRPRLKLQQGAFMPLGAYCDSGSKKGQIHQWPGDEFMHARWLQGSLRVRANPLCHGKHSALYSPFLERYSSSRLALSRRVSGRYLFPSSLAL